MLELKFMRENVEMLKEMLKTEIAMLIWMLLLN